ncbi:hypothetical protein MSG28_015872 [Choristoneura fumiferana]|uniref:Uncharacterized protein n=1 Tax=Choristoneura fumiferana TaxID=7141 RepID=A0ACC0K525_CHOFU|nr:hypothetical protein MSG28_015872 [Choristoneura fumiferana]
MLATAWGDYTNGISRITVVERGACVYCAAAALPLSKGVAKSKVNEEGDVKIMFYKTVDKTGKIFKAVETDISYEPYDNILEIVPNPKIVVKDLRFECDYCHNKCPNKTAMTLHIKLVHTKELNSKCSQCPRGVRDGRPAAAHERRTRRAADRARTSATSAGRPSW